MKRISTTTNAVHEMQALAERTMPRGPEQQFHDKWFDLGLDRAPTAIWFPRKIYPYAATLDLVFDVADGGDVDAILFAEERRHSPRDSIRNVIGNLQTPIIDLTGLAAEFADVHFDVNNQFSWTETAQRIMDFRDRRANVAPAYRYSVESDIQLLAHTYVSGRKLTPKRYPIVKNAIAYPGFWSAEITIPVAEKLVRQGHFKKSFFDRMHQCRACTSRRLTVREECPSCHSADLNNVELIHHYHCAHLAPEGEFRRGTMLVCPKCEQQLRNYGKDYDKPGQALFCNACSKSTSEPEVGFVCMDCSAQFSGEDAQMVDIFAYEITDAGVAAVTGSILGASANQPVAIGQRSANATTNALVIAEISYKARQAITDRRGLANFDRLRQLFIENLTNKLGEDVEHRAGPTSDYLLVLNFDDEAGERIEALAAESVSILSDDIEPEVEFATRAGRAGS